MTRIVRLLKVLAPLVTWCGAAFAQSNDCATEINGALKGGPGNIQDQMFHSLSIDPTNENVVYAGTETNGIFKTTDGGVTWTRLRRGLKCGTQQTGYPQIFDIAVDPMNPQTVYAATVNGPGPGDNPLSPTATAGIYKSTDGGETWAQKIQGFTSTYTTYVLVDSTNPNRVYAGVGGAKSSFFSLGGTFYEGGIWASNNGGDAWNLLPVPPGLRTNILIDMVLRGTNQQTIYASGQLHGNDAPVAYGLVRSRDGGQTWSIVNPQGVTIMGFDAYQQDSNIIYGHDDSNSRRVHKSTDGGTTWTALPAGFFGVIRIHPRDSRTVWYTGRTSIVKSTDGLTTSRQTYSDTGLSENQQMVDIKVSVSNPNVVWAAAKGYYVYKSTDGGETFTKITAIRDLVYGSAVSHQVPAVFSNTSNLTGMAFVNSAGSAATVTLTAYKDDGTLLAGPGIQNPATVSIPGKGQYSRLSSELFGANQDASFWTKVAVDRPGISGFFLNFDPALNTMDGANFSNRLLYDFVLPELQNADISLVNPNSASAELTLTWFGNDGVQQETRSLRLSANGRFFGTASQLFPSFGGSRDGYIRITSDRGMAAAERFGGSGASNMLAGLHADTGSRFLYSPQYVNGGGYKSTLTLVSLDGDASTVTLSWIDKNGSRIGQQVNISLPGRGRAVFSDPGAFGVAIPDSGLEGYLSIRSSSARLTGTVRFGDNTESRFQTSLPLLSESSKDSLYAHIAQDATFFTGVAVINSNSEPANVTVSIFNSAGVEVGAGRRTIAGFARISEVLTQLDSRLPALSNGYFRVTADRPVFSFAVFGTHSLSVLAGIPAQVLP